MKMIEERFWSRVSKDAGHPKGCWEWQAGTNKDGYGAFCINGRNRRAHRLSFQFEWGVAPPSWLHVLHECDNPACVNPAHLWLGTDKDNMDDMAAKGRRSRCGAPKGERHGSRLHPERVARGNRHGSRLHPERLARGERNGSAKLTSAQVFGMRILWAAQRHLPQRHPERMAQQVIAKAFGISKLQVSNIIHGKSWA